MDLRQNMRLKQIGFSLLLILGMVSAYAGPGGYGRGEREIILERGAQGPERSGERQGAPRRGGFFGIPETSGYSVQGDSGSGIQDGSRRQGRMSPEERRALRRQIDEAGHDLYFPKR